MINDEMKKEIFSQLKYKFGTDNRVNQLIEELGELIVVLNHWRRGKKEAIEVLIEVVDVVIAIQQLQDIMCYSFDNYLDREQVVLKKLQDIVTKNDDSEDDNI